MTIFCRFQQMNISTRIQISLQFHFMSEQFSFEEAQQIDWLKDASQFTDKHLYTHSQVSKEHFLQQMLHLDYQYQKVTQTTSTLHHKEKSKINSKNYRERKKCQLQHFRRQVEHLQRQNQFLKIQKHCRWCRKPYAHTVLYSQNQLNTQELENCRTCNNKEESLNMDLEFQKPQFFKLKNEERRGKIWIALGILLLVLGITIYGFQGDKRGVKEIQIYRQQMNKWSEQLKSTQQQFFEVKMKLKQQKKSMTKLNPGELRIYFRQQPKENQKLQQEKDKISINKELLFGIHAQLEDIGVYL